MRSLYSFENDFFILSECLKTLIKNPEDIEKYKDFILFKEKLKHTIELYYHLHSDYICEPKQCNSPEWEDILTTKDNEKHHISLSGFFKNQKPSKRKPCKNNKQYNLDILEVIEKAGIKMKNRMILCPFHAEKTPSCRIYPETNTFFCFGCKKHGTAYDLAKQLGVTNDNRR